MKRAKRARRPKVPIGRLDPDEAFLALLVGAMTASGHVSPEEAARAHNIIWSMRRFRRKSGETVDRGIDRMRTLIEHHAPAAVIDAASRRIPARLRPAAFAVSADLVLADGKIEPLERRFLGRLAASLRLDRAAARTILDVVLLKNSA